MRPLAHIEIIEWIKPIDGADRIELCGVLGWQCVVKKGDFKVGDKVVYIEVDSVMPEKPEFEFLRDRKFRVRTIKLRGQISQGLILPLYPTLPEYVNGRKQIYDIGEGYSEYLGITKYETPTEKEEFRVFTNRKNKVVRYFSKYPWYRRLFFRPSKADFPPWVKKTDEERIQNIPQILEQYKDYKVQITEKIDYQSGTWTSQKVNWFTTRFVVASRNFSMLKRDNLYWEIAKKYNLEAICKLYPGITIQGEQGSTKVQDNKYGLREPRMFVFNVIFPDGHFLNPTEVNMFCVEHGLEAVPYLGSVTMERIGTDVESWVEFARGASRIADTPREGIVVRAIRNGEKILSFKVINPDFLLRYEN